MRLLLISVLTLFFLSACAEEPVERDLWDPAGVRAFFDEIDTSVSGGFISPNWIGESSEFWYTDETYLVFVDPEEAETKNVIALSVLSEAIDRDDYSITKYDPVTDVMTLSIGTRLFKYDVKTGELTESGAALGPLKTVREMFPIQGWDQRELRLGTDDRVLTLIGDDIGVRSGDGAVLWQTDDGAADDAWFYANDIWESSGSIVSPDGSKIVARLHDIRGVTPQLILDQTGQNESVSAFSYWARAGQPLPITSFFVFDVEAGERLETEGGGDENTFAFFIDWSVDGSGFFVIRYNRTATRQELLRVDAQNGQARVLLTDQRTDGTVKWPGGPKTIVELPSGGGFLWRSDESGFFQWYLYGPDGTQRRAVTNTSYDIGEIVHVDEEQGSVFAIGQPDVDRPYDTALIRFDMGGTDDVVVISDRIGQASAEVSPDGEHFLLHHSHLDSAPQSILMDRSGSSLLAFPQAEVNGEIRETSSTPEEFSVLLEDGVTTVHGLIYKPHGFDPNKRYPVIDRIYGGMQSMVSRRVFPGIGLNYPGGEYQKIIPYLNSLGFVVVTVDAPGTPGRGRAFNNATYGTWPEGVIANHRFVIEKASQSRPYMDLDRVGIVGNSWGGYMALRGLIDAPDFFKVATSSVPETDLLDHVHWIEWQLGSVEQNREHYESNAISVLIDGIKAPLLIVAGTSDANVPVSNTMKLLDALAESGKPYDLVLFPGTNHPHQGRGDRYAYAANSIGQFLVDELGGPQPQ